MLMAVLGTILPSTLIILMIAMLFSQYADQAVVRRAFSALKPAVVALIAVPLIQLAKKSCLTLKNAWYPLAVAILVGFVGISPVYLILLTIVYAIWESRR